MEKILRFFEKLIPEKIYRVGQPIYHFLMAFLAALFYGFPSHLRQGFGGQARKMIIIGVTGTKGKTTTCNLIAQIFNFAGYKIGMATTINFRIGEREWRNETKQTMLGRFQLQKLLARMAKEDCEYAIIETSSEGILQYRHRFIDYDAAVFTNLSAEHIERHAGFENYRNAKVKLFEKVARKKDGIGVYNLDDENIGYFLEPDIKIKYGYGKQFLNFNFQFLNKFRISNIKFFSDKTEFEFDGIKFEMPLIGEFNVYNATAAILTALAFDVSIEKIKEALKRAKSPEGRMEIIYPPAGGKDFSVVIDYAHEPTSLEAVYKAARESGILGKDGKMICLLGAQGGGRDKWKRPKMGEIAAQYCDEIILTNEDPYNEPPLEIINQIEEGIGINQQNQRKSAVYKIIDRKEAIKKAISLAKKGDAVILTGKGGEVWMCVENNKKIPWDEKGTVEQILNIDI